MESLISFSKKPLGRILVATATILPLAVASIALVEALLGSQSEISVLISMVCLALVTFGCLHMISKHLEGKTLEEYGLLIKDSAWWRLVLRGCVCGLVGMTVVFFQLALFANIQIIDVFVVSSDLPFIIAALFLTLAFALEVLVEEILFRGFFLKTLLEGFTRMFPSSYQAASIYACICSSCMWAATVALLQPEVEDILGLVLIFFYGIGFSALALFSGSIAMTVGIHFAWNVTENIIFSFHSVGTIAGGGVVPSTTGVLYCIINGAQWLVGGNSGPESGIVGLIGITTAIMIAVVIVKKEFANSQWLGFVHINT